MLMASAGTARRKGWRVELAFSELSRGRDWLEAIDHEHIPYRFVDVRGSRSAEWASWAAAEASLNQFHRRLARVVGELVDEHSGPTILHTHFSTFNVAAALGTRKKRGAFVIWHEHSMRRPGFARLVGGTVKYRVLARNVSAFLCVAPDVTETIMRIAPSDRVRFFPNAIDLRRFAPATIADRENARAKLGIHSGSRVLLHFGSHWLRKGGDVYVAAFKSLLRNGTGDDLRGVVVGGEEARAAVEAAGLQSAITVMGPTEAVHEIYSAADMLVCPSRSEGMPFALLEALAMGLPVIASDIPGHAFVAKTVAACRLTKLTPESIAATIRATLAQTADERMSEQRYAREWILEHMSLDAWAQRMMHTYDAVLSSAQSQR
jgi:glycosyltransferase involved in cell wall biosynthesis